MKRFALSLALLLAPVVVSVAHAQAPVQLDRLQRADGAQVVPDRFLRRWDPVTVLFPADTGPAQGGPEDAPERLVTLAPARPGAWQWLGPRTLQFRPTEPWEPLRRVGVTVGGTTTQLVPLLPAPVQTAPSEQPNGSADLDTIALTFDQPVDEQALARLLTIELRPQAGAAADGTAPPAQLLTAQDFDLRPVERRARTDRQTYLIVLHRPLPDGRVATLRLRLSDAPGMDDPTFQLALRSAAPFVLTDQYCGDNYSHALQDGVTVCTPEQDSTPKQRRITLQFSETPEALDIVQARGALRITPDLDDLAVGTGSDRELHIDGRFKADTVYRVTIAPGALHDTRGRPLAAAVAARFSFAPGTPALSWDAHQGVVERLGPQMVPLRGHGYDRADLRIVAVDPLGRDFWPFPRAGLVTSDDRAPPLPGREPPAYVEAGPISGDAMARRIQALGSPAVSELVELPIRRGGVDAKFGIDIAPLLARIAGPGQPGTYLLGLRPVDGSFRQWARVQVTDLSLTTVEEAEHVRFVVTSLASTQPVAGAEVRLDGVRDGTFVTLARGVTGADGAWTLIAPLPRDKDSNQTPLRRIVVVKATDTLVLEPQRGPQQYAGETWSRPAAAWIGWVSAPVAERREKPRLLCHVFTERPIYRPEEPILIAGMVRRYQAGGLAYAAGAGEVVVSGPNEQQWKLPVTLDEIGGFHLRFDQKTEATGEYAIQYQPHEGEACGAITVKKEAYRLPTFEVLLNGPAKAPLDAPFQVNLLARFFAGGLLSERPITWRVTQYPYVWTPPGREGFSFSSDSRFAGDGAFRTTPVLNRDSKTDVGGAAALTLDPTIEPTAQPRQYLVEATVTGDDDLQVRSTQRITALPPFVLGVKVPRYVARPGAIDAEIVALDADGHETAGLPLTVRLVHRQWNSLLQASDFAQGAAKYETQVLDETVEERHASSGAAPLPVHFDVREAGVYIVELEAADQVGRRQSVKVDLFMAGDTPVTWSRPPAQTVTLTAEHDRYAPGETATLVIQSPFQTARALAIVEEPEGRFRYEWVDVSNGFGRLAVPVRKQQVPRLAVHVLLMRGRLPGPPAPGAPFDQGKPVTLAATKWITVTPVEHQVKVTFEAPATARPAQEVDLLLHLADAAGQPLAGEATVWMVDQAVLALAREQPLDPLPQFIVDRPSRMAARDTRSLAFGVIPLAESPGGDEAGDFGMENISVRKNFTPVPFYEPRVKFGADGIARLHIKLPDTLTVYMLRAKAVSGPDRFGFGSGEMRIRQPVVAQAVLPRFVRNGDSFSAGLLGRIVEGPGGDGRAAISLDNLALQGPAEQSLAWDGQRPVRLDYTVTVPEPAPGATLARVRFLLQRSADRVSDGVQIDLPIRPDRPVIHRRDLLAVGPAGTLEIPAIAEALRPASYARNVTLASDADLVRLVAGIGYLLRYPCGCTEQRIALVSGELALLPFTPLLEAAGLQGRIGNDVAATIATIRLSTDDDGLVAFWPHTKGSVWLTASAYRVLIAADRAGLAVDKPLAERLAKVLTAALRSDYPHLLSDEALFDRVAALTALADAGQLAADYAAELAARAGQMPTDSVAEIAGVLSRQPNAPPRLLAGVLETLWSRVNLVTRDGKPVYAGLVDSFASPEILSSEARSLAAVTRAVALAAPQEKRLAVLRAGLVGLADGQGWGNTNATAAALRALAALWQAPALPVATTIALPDRSVAGTLDRDHPLTQARTASAGPAYVQAAPGIAVLAGTDYVPAEPGAQAHARQDGFVLTRTLFRVPPPQGQTQPPLERIEPAADGSLHLKVGDVIEEVAELATPDDRTNVALRLPLAAGLEPLNPALANAPAYAAPSAGPSLVPSWSSYGDDEVLHVFLTLPRGTVTLRGRVRASIPGSFTQPPASAEMLYRPGVSGSTAGARVVVEK